MPGAVVAVPLALIAQWLILIRLTNQSVGRCATVVALAHGNTTVAGIFWLMLISPIVDPRGLASGAFVTYGHGPARAFVTGTLLLVMAELPLMIALNWGLMRLLWRPEVTARRALLSATCMAACVTVMHALTAVILLSVLPTARA